MKSFLIFASETHLKMNIHLSSIRAYLLLPVVLLQTGFMSSKAQSSMDLSGTWDFCIGNAPQYNDQVKLPGSMLTNLKGDPVSIKTQWTGSLYDSSFYFNPYMEKYRVLKEKYPERKNLWNDIVRVGLYIVGETSIYNVKDYDAFLALIERIYLVIDDIIKDIHPTEFYNRIDMIRIVKEILKENNLPVSLASPCRWCGWYCIDSMHGMYDPETLNYLIHALCKFIKENKKD